MITKRRQGLNPEQQYTYFLSRTRKDENGCLIWKDSIDWDGYGHTWIDGRTVNVHRFIAAHVAGLTLNNLNRHDIVRHTCDNPSCINPEHLIIGTASENMQDASNKGRTRGENSPHHYLTEEDVRAIRTEYKNTRITQARLAKKYNVSQVQISNVITRYSWSHVE